MRTNIVALTLALAVAAPARSEGVAPIGRFDWDTDLIVGLSGLEVSSDGMGFSVVGDRGFWMTGRFLREGANAVIVGLEIERMEAILGSNGFPVAARRVGDWSDSEGLAIAPDGTAWIAFERWAHVWRYDAGLGDTATWIKDHPTFYDYAENRQLEALALSPERVLYAFPEKPLKDGFPIYRLENGDTWVIDGYLPERDLFSIVGADFDENGDLYLLERKLVVGIWWQSRIRRVRLDGSEDATLWTGERGEYGNLEGIALWRDAGGLRIVAVSDDNSDASEPTHFVEFRLTE